jgi:hypothetical protein
MNELKKSAQLQLLIYSIPCTIMSNATTENPIDALKQLEQVKKLSTDLFGQKADKIFLFIIIICK